MRTRAKKPRASRAKSARAALPARPSASVFTSLPRPSTARGSVIWRPHPHRSNLAPESCRYPFQDQQLQRHALRACVEEGPGSCEEGAGGNAAVGGERWDTVQAPRGKRERLGVCSDMETSREMMVANRKLAKALGEISRGFGAEHESLPSPKTGIGYTTRNKTRRRQSYLMAVTSHAHLQTFKKDITTGTSSIDCLPQLEAALLLYVPHSFTLTTFSILTISLSSSHLLLSARHEDSDRLDLFVSSYKTPIQQHAKHTKRHQGRSTPSILRRDFQARNFLSTRTGKVTLLPSTFLDFCHFQQNSAFPSPGAPCYRRVSATP